ncbi:MAG: hypothetical protein AAGF57_08885 [Pseudomonadota bacterium]
MSNRHIVIALIVAPMLALLAWFFAGKLSGEQPLAAQHGQSYPLLAKSNCRRTGGVCDLVNEEFRLKLTRSNDRRGLLLLASHPLQGVLVAVGPDGEAESPIPMRQVNGEGTQWRLDFAATPQSQHAVRVAAVANGARYFAETTALFLH